MEIEKVVTVIVYCRYVFLWNCIFSKYLSIKHGKGLFLKPNVDLKSHL